MSAFVERKPRFEGGQVDIFGKGDKTRYVLFSPELWADLQSLRGVLVLMRRLCH